MKKVKMMALFLAVFFVCGLNSVQAISVDDIDYAGSNVEVTEADGRTTLKLTGDAVQDIVISENDGSVYLDLNGFTLTNYTPACEAVKVEEGGILTITDTSDAQTGKITQRADSTYAVITNQGILIINAGTFETNLNFYVIGNEKSGQMSITGGTFKTTSTTTSLIGNGTINQVAAADGDGASLTIQGGNFTAGATGIKNAENSKLNIFDGEFESGAYTVANWGHTFISGGELTSTAASPILLGTDGSDPDAKLELYITGGTFKATDEEKEIIELKNDVDPTATDALKNAIAISGGTYSKDITEFISADYEIVTDESGNVTVQAKEQEAGDNAEPTPAEEKPSDKVKSPDTLDKVTIFGITGLFGVIAFVGAAIALKKKLS